MLVADPALHFKLSCCGSISQTSKGLPLVAFFGCKFTQPPQKAFHFDPGWTVYGLSFTAVAALGIEAKILLAD
ncbi:MAG TPA: hypothetical protein VF676_06050 [Flavobacterium sp.]